MPRSWLGQRKTWRTTRRNWLVTKKSLRTTRRKPSTTPKTRADMKTPSWPSSRLSIQLRRVTHDLEVAKVPELFRSGHPPRTPRLPAVPSGTTQSDAVVPILSPSATTLYFDHLEGCGPCPRPSTRALFRGQTSGSTPWTLPLIVNPFWVLQKFPPLLATTPVLGRRVCLCKAWSFWFGGSTSMTTSVAQLVDSSRNEA